METIDLTESRASELRLPLSLYICNADGRHAGGLRIVAQDPPGARELTYQEARRRVRWALEQRYEVRVADSGDHLVLHIQGGRVAYAVGGSLEEFWAAAECLELERITEGV